MAYFLRIKSRHDGRCNIVLESAEGRRLRGEYIFKDAIVGEACMNLAETIYPSYRVAKRELNKFIEFTIFKPATLYEHEITNDESVVVPTIFGHEITGE